MKVSQAFIFLLQRLLRQLYLVGTRALSLLGFGRHIRICKALWQDVGFLSDGTVVCRCNDAAATVVLGSLEEEGIQSIWNGSRTRSVRSMMLRGYLPGLSCIGCSARVHKQSSASDDLRAEAKMLPVNLYLEPSVRCNLHCTGCRVEEYVASRKRDFMDVEEFTRNISLLSESLNRVYLLFSGECFLSPDVFKLAYEIKKIKPEIELRTECNGLLLDTPEKRKAVIDTFSQVTFSIDGVDQRSYELYRRGGSFEKAYSNLRQLILERDAAASTAPEVIWKYILFRWNDSEEQIDRLFKLLHEAKPNRFFFVQTIRPLHGLSWRYNAFRSGPFARLKARQDEYNEEPRATTPQSQ